MCFGQLDPSLAIIWTTQIPFNQGKKGQLSGKKVEYNKALLNTFTKIIWILYLRQKYIDMYNHKILKEKILTHCVVVVVLSTSSALSISAELLLLLLLLAFKSNEKSLSLPSFHSLKISSASWLSSPSGRKGLSQPWYELQK